MFPCWERSDWAELGGFYRDLEMERFGFVPCVQEPKCMIGFPSERPGPERYACMMRYFDEVMLPKIPDIVERLQTVYLRIRLGMPSYEAIAYPDIKD